MAAWLVLTYPPFHCNVLRIKMFENVIHQIDGKNKWLLLPASFTAKYELVFVLTLGNAFF